MIDRHAHLHVTHPHLDLGALAGFAVYAIAAAVMVWLIVAAWEWVWR